MSDNERSEAGPGPQHLPAETPVTDDLLKDLVGRGLLHTLKWAWWGTQPVSDAEITSLDLSATKVTDSGLEHLAGLANLTMLSLSGTRVTGAGLIHLAGLTKLATLNLAWTPLTDSGLAHLASLKCLRELDLSGTQVTDEGLRSLASLHNLTLIEPNYQRRERDPGRDPVAVVAAWHHARFRSVTCLLGTGIVWVFVLSMTTRSSAPPSHGGEESDPPEVLSVQGGIIDQRWPVFVDDMDERRLATLDPSLAPPSPRLPTGTVAAIGSTGARGPQDWRGFRSVAACPTTAAVAVYEAEQRDAGTPNLPSWAEAGGLIRICDFSGHAEQRVFHLPAGTSLFTLCFSHDGEWLVATGAWFTREGPGYGVKAWKKQSGAWTEAGSRRWRKHGEGDGSFNALAISEGKLVVARGGQIRAFALGDDGIGEAADPPQSCVWAGGSPDELRTPDGVRFKLGYIGRNTVVADGRVIVLYFFRGILLGLVLVSVGQPIAFVLVWPRPGPTAHASDYYLPSFSDSLACRVATWTIIAGLVSAPAGLAIGFVLDEVIGEWPSARTQGQIARLALSPDGGLLAAAEEEGALTLWEVSGTSLKQRGDRIETSAPVKSLAFSADGTLLASGHDGPEPLRLWRTERGLEWHRVLLRGRGRVTWAAFAQGDKALVAEDDRFPDGRLRVWSIDGGKPKEIHDESRAAWHPSTGQTPLLFTIPGDEDDSLDAWEVLGGRMSNFSRVQCIHPRQRRTLCWKEGKGFRLLTHGEDYEGRTRILKTPTRVSGGLTWGGYAAHYQAARLNVYELSRGGARSLSTSRWYQYPYSRWWGDPRLEAFNLFALGEQRLHYAAVMDVGGSLPNEVVVVSGLVRGMPTNLDREERAYPREIALSDARRLAAIEIRSDQRKWEVELLEVEGESLRLRQKLQGPATPDGWRGIVTGTGSWLGFLADGKLLLKIPGDIEEVIGEGPAVRNKVAQTAHLWDITGPEPKTLIDGKPLKDVAADLVKHFPPGVELPPALRRLVVPLKFTVVQRWETPDTLAVWREHPDGRKSHRLTFKAHGHLRVEPSRDGEHLVVEDGNSCVAIVRVELAATDERLAASCDAVLAKDPANTAALLQRAAANLRMERYHLALADAAAAGPASAEGLWFRSQVHFARRDFKQGEADLTRLLALDPRHAAALHRRGLCRLELRRYRDAKADIAEALKLAPALGR